MIDDDYDPHIDLSRCYAVLTAIAYRKHTGGPPLTDAEHRKAAAGEHPIDWETT